MSCIAPCEGIKSSVTELFYYQALFTEAGAWILHKKLSCLSPLFSVFLCRKTIRIFGVKENENWEWMGGLWRDVSECADDKLGMAYIEHIETECGYLLCVFGVVCGKETGLSVGNGLLLIQSWRSAFCYHLWWKSSAWFKEGKCRKRVFVHRPDLMSPTRTQLMSEAFKDAR